MQHYIYFLEDAKNEAIKIGTSTNPRDRASAIQVSTPSNVVLLRYVPVKAPYDVEEFLHRQFQHLYIRGEWFRNVPELKEFALRGDVPQFVPQGQRSSCAVALDTDDKWSLPQLSELVGVSARTIRYYISIYLLPGPCRSGPGAYYTEKHRVMLLFISEKRAQRLSLTEIRSLLEKSLPTETRSLPQTPAQKEIVYAVSDDVIVRIPERLSPWRKNRILSGLAQFERDIQKIPDIADENEEI